MRAAITTAAFAFVLTPSLAFAQFEDALQEQLEMQFLEQLLNESQFSGGGTTLPKGPANNPGGDGNQKVGGGGLGALLAEVHHAKPSFELPID